METQAFLSTLNKCLDAGITVTELADEFKVSESAIERWKEGKIPSMGSVRNTVNERMQGMLQKHTSST